MKYLTSLLLLPSAIFANSIGNNSIGFKIGQANFGAEVAGIKNEYDGFGFEINGNIKVFTQDNYGVDIALDSIFGSGLKGPGAIETDITKVDGAIRPYMQLSGITLFANIGFSHGEFEIPGTIDESETSFSPGLGFEFKLDKIIIKPSVDWVDYGLGTEGTFFTLPLSYELTEKYGLTTQYDLASFDSVTTGGITGKTIYDSLLFGVNYKF